MLLAVGRLSTDFGNIKFFDGCQASGESGHSLLIEKKGVVYVPICNFCDPCMAFV